MKRNMKDKQTYKAPLKSGTVLTIKGHSLLWALKQMRNRGHEVIKIEVITLMTEEQFQRLDDSSPADLSKEEWKSLLAERDRRWRAEAKGNPNHGYTKSRAVSW